MGFYNQLKIQLQAKVPCIYIETTEYLRLRAEIKKCSEEEKLDIKYWNEFDGLDGEKDIMSVLEDLNSKLNSKEDLKHDITIFEHADLLEQPENVNVVRNLAILISKLRDKKHQIIIVAAAWKMPNFIQNEIAVLDFSLPDRNDIKSLLNTRT